jgi:hypothetical protein
MPSSFLYYAEGTAQRVERRSEEPDAQARTSWRWKTM